MKHTITVGVFGIITNEQGEVLLCHRNDYNLWNLPGGSLEKGETPWQCMIREAKEETGLDVEVSRFMGIYAKPHKDEIVFMFVCNVIGGKLTLNEEARDLRYFTLDSIPKNTVPKQVERLKHYFADKNKVYLEEQGGKSSIDMVKAGNL
ncbi:MAG: NUDIX domain-containing protein [Candidatus Magasanikbacteria bacterium]|nr:NUDIX domain-containing protein [Candidatus Magasanikbacteria bacterium]